MGEFGIGQPVRRFEDARLLRGQGRYIGDLNLSGQAHAVFLRSPHAHAEIRALDLAAARAAPGVLAVLTAEDIARDGLGTMKVAIARKRPDGTPAFTPPQLGLASGRVRHVGDPLAMVIAESLAQARDAAELIAVDYAALASVTDTAQLAAGGAAPVWDECPDNISNVFETGDKAKADAAFAGAAHIIKRRYVISRIFAHFMEPRGAIGVWDGGEQRYTLHADCNYVHRVRNALAANIFKIPESKIRVIAGDIGGSFGTKGWQNVEHRLVLWASRKLNRPVKWQCERAEAVQADEHARDQISEGELALDAQGKFLAIRVRSVNNVGAYIQSERNLLATFSNLATMTGCYRIPAAYAHVTCMISNTNPTAPYRGAGRPESIYIIERLIDDAARELKLDRLQLRRQNLVTPAEMPYRNGFGIAYDNGEFVKGFEMALQIADVAGFPARRAAAAKRGRLRGLGIINAIERAASPGQEFAEIRFNPGGSALVLMGTKNQGQGHETLFKQILNERLGIAPDEVQFIDGDTDRVAFGLGSMGSRTAVIGGSALHVASLKIIAKGQKIAAHLLEAAASDIEFKDGVFTVAGTDKKVALKEVAKAAFAAGRLPQDLEGGLFETGIYTAKTDTWPNGAHVCELEIDPDTGMVELCNYVVVDDVGTVINPIGVAGQIHGGVAQGLGQVLMEQVNYDAKSGQLLSGSFMDYAMPRADSTCNITLKSNPVPTATNPLGAKGAGEAGTVGALPAGMNALLDALEPLGVGDLPMPATPWRIWEAIDAAAKERQNSRKREEDMGQIVGAAWVAHHPGMMQPEEARRARGAGNDTDMVEGFKRLRARIDRVKPDAFVLFDTHWFTTNMHLVAGLPHYKGLYTSFELPFSLCRVPYDFPGAPELAAAVETVARERQVTARNVTEETLPLQYPTINVIQRLGAGEKVMPVGTCQNATFEQYMEMGAVIGEAIKRTPGRYVLLASGAMSHHFTPVDFKLRHPNNWHPDNISDQKNVAIDREIIALLQEGRHDLALSRYPDMRRAHYEGWSAHYVQMAGACGGTAWRAKGTPCSEYENAAGTGNMHVWFEMQAETMEKGRAA